MEKWREHMIYVSWLFINLPAQVFSIAYSIAYLALVLALVTGLVLACGWLKKSFFSPTQYRDDNLRSILCDLNIISWSFEIASRRIDVSPGTENIFGLSARELMRQPEKWEKLVHPYDLPRVRDAENDLWAGKKIMLEHRILLADGSTRWIHNLAASVKGQDGRLARLEGLVIDVTEQKELEEKMKHMAFYDALTGLPNRSMFENYFASFMNRGRYFDQKMAVVFIDLDSFKKVNDQMGHDAGDLLLKQVAIRLKSLLRGCDLLSRLGGDEFVTLLTRIQPESPGLVGQRIVEAFWEPFEVNGYKLNIGASVGISVYPDDGEDLETLMKNADRAMYMAKRKGKNASCVYNPSALERINK